MCHRPHFPKPGKLSACPLAFHHHSRVQPAPSSHLQVAVPRTDCAGRTRSIHHIPPTCISTSSPLVFPLLLSPQLSPLPRLSRLTRLILLNLPNFLNPASADSLIEVQGTDDPPLSHSTSSLSIYLACLKWQLSRINRCTRYLIN